MDDASPTDKKLRRAHPLAIALIERLHPQHARVLEIGSGHGRNTEALRAAGFVVDATADDQPVPATSEPYDAALSTHALLHGTAASLRETVHRIATALKPGAPCYATFASVKDARYGMGRKIEEHVFAGESGDEAGVPHIFFDEARLREMLEPLFVIESLEDKDADDIIGRWAHAQPLRGTVHFFVKATCR